MKREECRLVRYTASEGKALKWVARGYNYSKKEFTEGVACAERTATIDETTLVGAVEEISQEEYNELYKKHCTCIGAL
ncbi:MAG: hypothetical protein J6A59_03345 [Lachnospiraceae bacterium]|nr:hypothetical protein [Lachnospiraceae bacterium]